MKAYAVVLALLLVASTAPAGNQTFAELASASTGGAFGAGTVLTYNATVFQQFEDGNKTVVFTFVVRVIALEENNLTVLANSAGVDTTFLKGEKTVTEFNISAVITYDFATMTEWTKWLEPPEGTYESSLVPPWFILNPAIAEIYEGKIQGYAWKMLNETAVWITFYAGYNFTITAVMNEYNITEKAVIRSAPAGGLGTAACSNGSKTESYRLVEFIPAPKEEEKERTFDPRLILVASIAISIAIAVIIKFKNRNAIGP